MILSAVSDQADEWADFCIVIPAEREAREPGPTNPGASISGAGAEWVPDRLAARAVRDDKGKLNSRNSSSDTL